MVNRYVVVTTMLLILFTIQISAKNVLKKCCSKNEYFIFNDMNLKCVNIDLDKDFKFNKTNELWWLPQNNLKDKKAILKYNEIKYKALPSCAENSQDMFEEKHFHLHFSSGKVELEVKKDSSMHDSDVKGHGKYFSSETFCVDAAFDNNYVAIICPCTTIKCVRKCCMDSYAYDMKKKQCVDAIDMPDIMDWVPGFRAEYKASELEYYRLTSKKPGCKDYLTHLIQNISDESRLHLHANGGVQNIDTDELFSKDSYCGDYTVDNQEMLLYCPPKPNSTTNDTAFTRVKFTIYGILFIIGAVALFLVVVVAIVIPELRHNIHGKMSLAHNAMLFIGYVSFVVVLFSGDENSMSRTGCKVTSFIIQYSILSAFFWLNVMCIDIAWAFSGLRPIQGHSAVYRDRKKFAYYSLYAWGTTGLISIATAIVEFSTNLNSFKPNFGVTRCFFSDRGAMLLFFYGPMAVLLMVNIALFTYTAAKIVEIKRQTAILNSTDSSTNKKNKQRLILYIKLFSIMGVTWVFEVISWAVGDGGYYWIFTDVLNLLRGVFIFVIFCCKRPVYNLVRDKGLRMCGKEGLQLDSSFRQGSLQTNSSVCNVVLTPEAKRKHMKKKTNSKLPLVPVKSIRKTP